MIVASFWGVLLKAWNTAWPIALALLLFGLVVVIHEFGHFFFAKLFKVQVNEFAVGFGPALFKKKGKETLYALRLFPFGGYCAMEGEDEDSESAGSFQKKRVWQRMVIVAAGAVNNLLLGLILVGIMLSIQGQFYTTQIYGFVKDASSYQSGLRPGDIVQSVDGRRVFCSSDLSYMMMVSKDNALEMVVERKGETVKLNDVQFAMQEIDGKNYIQADFAVIPKEMTFKKPFSFLKSTVMQSFSVARIVWMSLIDLISGRFGMNELMGPVGVVSTVSETVSEAVSKESNVGMDMVCYIMALITINLGIVNLMPLPALDGGRLVFLLYELIFRKPVPQKYEGWIHGVGLALLLLLILVI
ncbi:MAG: site-2 protease family protein, partial [Clostridia bacterium]|nr:site-2 protease family protein [Clostridia bacterium]